MVGLLRSTESWPAQGGWRRGRRWLAVGWRFSGPTLPRLSSGEGFGHRQSLPEGVRRWHVGDGGFNRRRVPACGFIPRPCSGGPPAGSAVAVAAGGCCGLLSSSTSPCEEVGLTSLYWCAGELSRVSRLSCRSSAIRSRGA